jgi:hypothetical protein
VRVENAIEMLMELDPDEEIIIDWWDRSVFNRFITDDGKYDAPDAGAWSKVVEEWDKWEENNLTAEIWDWIHDALLDFGAWDD